MRASGKEHGCHHGIAADIGPFPKLTVGGSDDAGFLVEFADQVEQKYAAGFLEWDVASLVDDDAIPRPQLRDDFPSGGASLFFDQGIDQIPA